MQSRCWCSFRANVERKSQQIVVIKNWFYFRWIKFIEIYSKELVVFVTISDWNGDLFLPFASSNNLKERRIQTFSSKIMITKWKHYSVAVVFYASSSMYWRQSLLYFIRYSKGTLLSECCKVFPKRIQVAAQQKVWLKKPIYHEKGSKEKKS